jgi:hypothetical protein
MKLSLPPKSPLTQKIGTGKFRKFRNFGPNVLFKNQKLDTLVSRSSYLSLSLNFFCLAIVKFFSIQSFVGPQKTVEIDYM